MMMIAEQTFLTPFITIKIAHTVDKQNFETASPLDTKTHIYKTKLSNFGLCEKFDGRSRLGILNEHVQFVNKFH